ncbi:hypothetical protein [Salmonirosea aquatica]|uniref:Uncharacterized protein n=1 Tax=Salmonirosea aquatica TaxID=2654236 RepID=A0A7C9BE25_9BACT|nr:hypothetical protein [Cytophagaceae bacterium SJW1-29]
MERKKQRKLKVGVYRFWIEYKQFFEGESTRRMRKRARQRRLETGSFSKLGIFNAMFLAGIY